MIKKIRSFLSSIPMTAVSGVALVLSLVFSKNGINTYVDTAWLAVVISGIPLFILAFEKLIFKRGIAKISSALLISVATVAAIIIGDLFAAGEVVFIMALGEILEDLTTDRAKRGLKNLLSLSPVKARVIRDGIEYTVPAEEVKLKDTVRVLAGESIPVDGVIISGKTTVDQSVITGEAMPVDKVEGDKVFCATVNRFGVIDVEASAVGEDSSLKKLIRLVEEAEEKKAPTERIADRWASILVPLALLVAIIVGLITQDIERAVTVLVVFCPCALVLATPTAIMAAIGQATKRGVVIKSGEALEKMGKVDTVAFDKTGTLTHGSLHVSEVISYVENMDESALIETVASVEAKSEHPIGQALVQYAKESGARILEAADFKISVGLGAEATLGGVSVLCGNEQLLLNNGIDTAFAKEDAARLQGEGKTLVFVAAGGRCVGLIALSDTLRDEAHETVKALSTLHTETVLLTGDSTPSAVYFASASGIKSVHAELLPEDKLTHIKGLQNSGKTVCMVGDGVNDAPALKAADVGIAMGGVGSDIAVESADIALMRDGISSLSYLKRLANATVKTIRLCITLSMVINVAAVILSGLGLLNPTTGALVHNLGSFFVILISALLYDRKFQN